MSNHNTPASEKASNSPDFRVDKAKGNNDKDEHILDLRRKLKTLKEAFLKEREARGRAERQLAELKDLVINHEIDINEKESLIEKLRHENSQLHESLNSLNSLNHLNESRTSIDLSGTPKSDDSKERGSIGSTFTHSIGEMFKSIKGNQDDLKKLQVEYNYLRKQFDNVKERAIQADEEKEDLRTEIEALKTKLAETEEQLKEKTQENETLQLYISDIRQANTILNEQYTEKESEIQDLKSINESLSKERDQYKNSIEAKEAEVQSLKSINDSLSKERDQYKSSVEEKEAEVQSLKSRNDSLSNEKDLYKSAVEQKESEIQNLRNRIDSLSNERDHYKSSIEEKDLLIEEKNKLLEQLENKNKTWKDKKAKLKQIIEDKENYIAEQESKIQVFSVTRKADITTPAQIVLRSFEGYGLLEIETFDGRISLIPGQVVSITHNEGNEESFVISYLLKGTKPHQEIFEAKDTAKILKSLKKFMEKAIESNKEQNYPGIGEPAHKKEKKFLAEIVQFFGS